MQENTAKKSSELPSVVIRFAGDSGDGMQVTGGQFTMESAIAGNDIATFPDFPAEIRAPAGTLAGVSGFQINFSSEQVFTPGGNPDVLVAMNPAAFKANLKDLKEGGIIIANEDSFTEKNLSKVDFEKNPLEDAELDTNYRLFKVPITKLTKDALADSGLTSREIDRCKNFFTLGIMLWMFNRPSEHTISWIEKKFAKKPQFIKANTTVLKAGMTYAEATEIFPQTYVVQPAKVEAGKYRNVDGTTALAYGLVSAAQKSGLDLFFGAYPITPASSLLHELAKHKQYNVRTFQAEDEIAAICSAIGASFAGALAVTSSSGPGIALKGEALVLATITELPLVVINVQRGGPSTGLPTKTEQSDLLQAIYGRHGESPTCVLAVSNPDSAFHLAYEACRIAVKYMTPVMLLSDGFISNSAGPWKIPNPKDLNKFDVSFAKAKEENSNEKFMPYKRDEKTLARAWAIPGTKGLEHRIGGLEKEDVTGEVSYNPDNHQQMTNYRAEKIKRIASEIPKTKIDGKEKGELLVLGWGSTEGSITEAVNKARTEGIEVSRAHIHYMNPLPPDLESIIKNFKRVLVPEINCGQLTKVIKSESENGAQLNLIGFNQVMGLPLNVKNLIKEIIALARPQ